MILRNPTYTPTISLKPIKDMQQHTVFPSCANYLYTAISRKVVGKKRKSARDNCKIVNNYLPFDFEDKSYIVWCDYSSESSL